MEPFTFFHRTDSPFSLWYPVTIHLGGQDFWSAQQYIIYQKALLFDDQETATAVLASEDKKGLMKLARNVKGFVPAKWKDSRRGFAEEVNRAKFSQHEELKTALLATAGTILANANEHDVIWGIGLTEKDPDATEREKWRGENLLGEILTELRNTLQEG